MVIKHLLGDHLLPCHNFFSAIDEVLDIFDLPHGRAHMAELTSALQKTQYGRSIFRRAVLKQIREAESSSSRAMLVCGGKYEEDLEILKEYHGWLVGVEAPIAVRYQRAQFAQKGGQTLTFKEFIKRDRGGTEDGDVDILVRQADIVFVNASNSFVTLYDQVRAWLPGDI